MENTQWILCPVCKNKTRIRFNNATYYVSIIMHL